MIEEAFYSRTSGHSGVAALVSTRVRPIKAAQDEALPFVAYQTVSDVPTYSHDGDGSLGHARIQANCFGRTYIESHQIAEQVRLCWSGFKGTITFSATTYTIQSAFVEDIRDVPSGDASERGRERDTGAVSVDVLIGYTPQTAPSFS